MSGDGQMHAPRFENKVNWTTGIAVFGVLVSVGTWVYATGQFTARFDGLVASTSVEAARTDTRLQAVEASARTIENLSYRVTLIEQAYANVTATLAELNRAVNDQSADIRVIREIVTRIDRPAGGMQ